MYFLNIYLKCKFDHNINTKTVFTRILLDAKRKLLTTIKRISFKKHPCI